MEKIKCYGKCHECEALENGLIENAEICAIFTSQRRTFEIMPRLANMEKMIEKLLSQKGVEASVATPVETSDYFPSTLIDDEE